MECTCECSCDIDDGDPIDVRVIKMRKARKEHKCFECERIIKKGEIHEYLKGLVDGCNLVEWRTCLGCTRMRSDLRCCYGLLAEEVKHCFGVDIVTSTKRVR